MTPLPRRALLLVGATLLTGCSRGGEPARGCRTPSALVDFSSVGGASLGYEIGRRETTLKADPAFIQRLDAWAVDWATWSGLGAITRVWSYGAFVDKCDSWHAAGRAFDFAELEHEGGSVSCRFDQWQPGSAAQLKSYWRLAASLHAHFAYTLTYAYNEQHHNHIHVDNGISGEGASSFDSGSRVQVQFVQNACRHVFGQSVELTDTWDDQTRAAVRGVQRAVGISQPLSEHDGWQAFCRATASA